MQAARNESDEQFARRLQIRELGQFDSRTPLISVRDQTKQRDVRLFVWCFWFPQSLRAHPSGPLSEQPPSRGDANPTVINSRMNEITSSLTGLILVLTITIPQILAAVAVLVVHWSADQVCDSHHTQLWKLWSILSVIRMIAYDGVIVFLHKNHEWLQEHHLAFDRASRLKNSLDILGLIWFIMGNMWLFGDDDHSCAHPERSPIYNLCLSMIIINYIQICLPCILGALMIPVFCFCMPCLIRVLARMQNIHQQVRTSIVLEILLLAFIY
jgi:hypothetical protein